MVKTKRFSKGEVRCGGGDGGLGSGKGREENDGGGK
jgi:hypothetical protein